MDQANSDDIRELLCQGSDDMLDVRLHPKIRAWSNPAKAIEILEVLDACIHGALSSGFMVKTLQALYDTALKHENTTHAQLEPLATWRKEA